MRQCEACEAELIGGHKDRRFCNSTCRSRQHRALKKQAALAPLHLVEQQQRQQLRVMLEHMAKIAPNTARSVKSFVDSNGLECGEAAVRLCLSALHEGARLTA